MNEQSIQTSDTGEFASTASSESNMYSVFGGEFVASKQGKPLERERLVSCFISRCMMFVLIFNLNCYGCSYSWEFVAESERAYLLTVSIDNFACSADR